LFLLKESYSARKMGKTSLNPKIYLYICKANEPNGQNEQNVIARLNRAI